MPIAKCLDDPATILKQPMCLHALSKNLKGNLKLSVKEEQKCEKPECVTLKTVHVLKLKVITNEPCDSKLGGLLSGEIVVERLVTAFDQNGGHRGFHAGDFTWTASGIHAAGRLSGMTNVGTHRKPAFEPACQECATRGVMEGRLCGQILEAKMPEMAGCQIIGSYRLRYDPSSTGGSGTVVGVIEGVLICPCK
jgi:hypothetical protein